LKTKILISNIFQSISKDTIRDIGLGATYDNYFLSYAAGAKYSVSAEGSICLGYVHMITLSYHMHMV